MNMCRDVQAELVTTFSFLQQNLKLEISNFPMDTTTLVDLLDDDVCKNTLQNFATRIHAKNLRCATSLFVKYWSTLWILPSLYCQAAALPFVQWQSSTLAVELTKNWYWDRTLQLIDSAYSSFQVLSFHDIEFMLNQLSALFSQFAKVGRVSYVLLWENAAVRVVQFYRALQQQNLSKETQQRLLQQQEWLNAKSAQSFNLQENPFAKLWRNWHPELKTYMRQKCCFYFQLEEAGQELCRNCPLQPKQIKEMSL